MENIGFDEEDIALINEDDYEDYRTPETMPSRVDDVLCRVGMRSCLMRISHLSESFNDVRIFSRPKRFPT